MAFTVEDGTIVADANAYITVAYADDYFTDRGVASWTGSSTVKEQAIIRATDYIETRWGPRFMGKIEDVDQELSFPRTHLKDRDGRVVEGIPEKLKRATAEYALRALTAALYVEPVVDESGQTVTRSKEKVGPIEQELEYVEGGSVSTLKPIPAADNLLSEYVTSPGGTSRA